MTDQNLILAEKTMLEKLTLLLTNTSRQQLEIPGSIPVMALQWLVNDPNVDTYSFDRQVQRFAMAAFFFSTEGGAWSKSTGWLLGDDECDWYQSTNKDTCMNGTLQVLSLNGNYLYGPLPDEIRLLSSLEVLTLSLNWLTSSIPMEIQSLTLLTSLDLKINALTGMIPSEVGMLKKLKEFIIPWNSITGGFPSEIGQCTDLANFRYWYDKS